LELRQLAHFIGSHAKQYIVAGSREVALQDRDELAA
jgi:hypothetical protein